ncbi:transposase [Candidatus Kaiserbacteria bacterium]|nr:transposase [Candidatus Kaiserbacteria bacterium]
MERKVPFVETNYYHLYARGVEKRQIFMSEADNKRFLLLLLACNRKKPVRIDNLLRKSEQGEPLLRVSDGESLVDLLVFALMPNHFHLVVREKAAGGTSRFMLKLMTAYSMFFNTKYERSGPLFTRPFRSQHVENDDYFRWLWAYIHLNPLALQFTDWEQVGIENIDNASRFLSSYKYSSLLDYAGAERPESRILSKGSLPADISSLHSADALMKILLDFNKSGITIPGSLTTLL